MKTWSSETKEQKNYEKLSGMFKRKHVLSVLHKKTFELSLNGLKLRLKKTETSPRLPTLHLKAQKCQPETETTRSASLFLAKAQKGPFTFQKIDPASLGYGQANSHW